MGICLKMMLATAGTTALLMTGVANAGQMRGFKPIATPEQTLQDLPEGSQVVNTVEEVPANEIADTARDLAKAWNGPGLGNMISDDKFDKDRFTRSMVTEVPRDARLELESVRGVRTLNQAIVPDGNGGFNRVSTVTATLSTRLITNDAQAGFVNAPGVNEVRFQVVEPLR